MDTVTKLRIAVGLLTRPSKHRVQDPEGGADRWMTAEALLVQLRLAVRNSSPGGSYTTSSNGTPVLISAAAFDLERTIRLAVTKQWAETLHLHHGHQETIGAKLRTWAAVAESDEILTRQAERYCTGWVTQIQGLLSPVRRREIRGKCPGCFVDRVIDHYDEEGGMVMTTALVVESSEATPAYARCLHCNRVWLGQDMWLLVHDLNGAEA